MKKMTKILLVLALSVCSLFTFSTTDVDAATHPYVTFNTPTIYMGEDSELNFTLHNGSNFECLYDFFVYDSNSDLVASKENHIVYGTNAKEDYTLVWDTSDYKAGTYYLEVQPYYYDSADDMYYYDEGTTQYFNITLKSIAVKSVKLSETSKALMIGDSFSLTATISPSNASNKDVTWTSSNSNVATVSSYGFVYAKQVGTTTITAKSSNGKTATCKVTVVSEDFPFADVRTSDWYYRTVKEAYDLGIMTGVGNYKFAPNDNISRAMVATVLYRIHGAPGVKFKTKFNDVKSGQWYSAAVTWASDFGVVNGYANGNFGPSNNITRQDLVIMLRNYANQVGLRTHSNTSLAKFSDSNKIASYAQSAFKWAVDNGLVGGSGDKLNPTKTATRAEAAKMFLQLYKMIKK